MAYRQKKTDETEMIAGAFSDLMSGAPTKNSYSKSREVTKSKKNKSKANLKPAIAVITVLVVGGLATFAGTKLIPTSNPASSVAVLGAVTNFKPYQINESKLDEDLTIDSDKASYESGVLFMPVKTNNDQIISVSQQAVPEEFANTVPSSGETIETPYGKGAISNISGRTTINVISDNGVFVLISAPSSVSTDTLKQIAQSLEAK